MRPHVTTLGSTPRPRNESVASSTIMLATAKTATTITGEITLGSTCRAMMRASPAPLARAACTKSRVFTARVSPRTRRA